MSKLIVAFAVGFLLVAGAAAMMVTEDEGDATSEEVAPGSTPASVESPAILSLGDGNRLVYFEVLEAHNASLTLSHAYDDTSYLDGFTFIQPRAGPGALLTFPGDPLDNPLLQGSIEGERIDSRSAMSTADRVESSPLSWTNITVEDESERFVVGVGVREGISGTARLEWTGNASIEPTTVEADPIILETSELEGGPFVTGRLGPTQVQDANAQLPVEGSWAATATIGLPSGELTYCMEASEQSCFQEDDWSEPTVYCTSSLARSTELSLSMESEEGSLFFLTAMPSPYPITEDSRQDLLSCEHVSTEATSVRESLALFTDPILSS